jgi:hypothetical protein
MDLVQVGEVKTFRSLASQVLHCDAGELVEQVIDLSSGA